MTQREQYPIHRALRDAMKAYTYTPGRPDDRAVIERLAVRAQALAIEFGEDLTWQDALKRSRENLRFVRALAGIRP